MVSFTKMQGLGNDYVYIDCTKSLKIKNISNVARKISDRHFGIGSDGLILICRSDIADFKMRMFNYDGSEAEMCGNGIRCVGKYVYNKGLSNKKFITIETLAGVKNLELIIEENKVKSVMVDMGEPIFNPNKIPVNIKSNPVLQKAILINNKEFKFSSISMGNPHAIILVENVDNFDVEMYGSLIEKNNIFPRKTNVEFVEIIDKSNIKMRVWERGAGETLACGTGACAAVVACYLNGKTDREISVELLGGKLKIKWDKEDNHVYMNGPAEIVYEGIIELKEFEEDENDKN